MSLRSSERPSLSEKTHAAYREVDRQRLHVRGALFRHDAGSLRHAAVALAAAAQVLAAAARDDLAHGRQAAAREDAAPGSQPIAA